MIASLFFCVLYERYEKQTPGIAIVLFIEISHIISEASMRWKGDNSMKHFRYILLCLSLIAAVGLMVGCGCGNPQDETSSSTSADSGSGMYETQTQESTRETMQESGSYPADLYETEYGSDDATGSMEDGAGSMATDEGMTVEPDVNGGPSQNGGLMEDVTDSLEQIGEDITGATEDTADGTRTRR